MDKGNDVGKERVFQDIASYIVDHEMARELIHSSLSSNDPEEYLEEKLRSSSGTLAGDIRIILNRIRKDI